MLSKTYFFFRCTETHEFFGSTIEAGTFVGNGGRLGVPFNRAQVYMESALEKNKEMYFPEKYWEIVSFSISENDLKLVE